MLKQELAIGVIPYGGIIMSILHPSLKIGITDSLNFLFMPLSKTPGQFCFKDLRLDADILCRSCIEGMSADTILSLDFITYNKGIVIFHALNGSCEEN
ncbi:hypothetical protein CEXT_340391 [Caerostris extrusa]|uniref:Uncharacterized protein n=1 Tax=Caerostris extrusa TaxID=172846 RepID=A0AAV4M836_CAEEX|nr:hypothetical protein CEXT_340391 [Caerostris extrusa]